MGDKLQNALQKAKMDGASEGEPMTVRLDMASESEDDLVMQIARIATLADQCDQEGNPATAVSMRRVAQALWGEAFKRQARARDKK